MLSNDGTVTFWFWCLMNIYSWIRYGLDVTVQSLNWQEWLTGIHGWLVLEGAKNDSILRYYDLN